MTDDLNPFASPMVNEPLPIRGATEETRAEAIRREHLKHETSVKSIGLLYYLGGGLMVLGAVGLSIGFLSEPMRPVEVTRFLLVPLAIYGVLGPIFLATGYGLRRLQGWVKWPVGIFSGIGLLGLPVGTLINAVILYLIFCRKGQMVLSPEYQQIMAATPHIKYRTSVIAWIALGLVIAVVLAFIILPFLLDKGH